MMKGIEEDHREELERIIRKKGKRDMKKGIEENHREELERTIRKKGKRT